MSAIIKGSVIARANVTGRTCSRCVDGYWNLTAGNDLGCQGKLDHKYPVYHNK